jgi:hypothetical protein
MDVPHSRFPGILALVAGVGLGWLLATVRPAPVHASAGDRAGESIVATGPVLVQFDDSTRSPIPLDALYLLDYKGGRLLATIPTYRQTGSGTQLIDSFAERDLAADFKLDLEVGPRPRFLMTTGSLGSFSSGWAPLYVFETTTGQLAVYRMHTSQTLAPGARPKFELVELKSYARPEGNETRR